LGVDTLEYMNYENGSDMISYDQMKKLASLYHIDLVEVFTNSDEVKLYDTVNANTDEINIEYFTAKETFLDKVKNFYAQNKVTSTIIVILLITILIMSIILKNTVRPFTPTKDNINRLSVSETTVVYIDDYSHVNGSGSNANGELSNLTSNSAIKVAEGEGFTIILNEDGTLNSAGLIRKYANEIDGWRNIVDVAAGGAHVIAVDSNGRVHCTAYDNSQACDLNDVRNIKKVYATNKGSIVMDNNGTLSYAGTFIGSGSLRNYTDILDIASSNNILAVLKKESEVDVYTNNSQNYLEAESWDDIVDVACGDSYVAGLDRYGKVHIEIDNDSIRSEVEKWSNIIAIDGGSDYLIGFDGEKIFGVGNNSYKQFVKEELVKQRLDMVSDVEYNVTQDSITVQFKGVSNASGYIVSIDVGIGVSRRIDSSENVVKFESGDMTDGKNYTITIISIGEGDYTDSDPYKLSFTYMKPEETYTFRGGENKPEAEFVDYLLSLGVSRDHIIAIPGAEDDICADNIVTVSGSSLDGKTLTRSELLETEIEYTYCKVLEND
ncbi:MAG: hypothetical protein J6S49_06090, partial [Erysipelotrichaceae bacterium]|nr:hypothetical protein [Erysipelotrichaceae bacterium]